MSWIRSLSNLENIFSLFAWIFSGESFISFGVIATVIVLLIVLNADKAANDEKKDHS